MTMLAASTCFDCLPAPALAGSVGHGFDLKGAIFKAARASQAAAFVRAIGHKLKTIKFYEFARCYNIPMPRTSTEVTRLLRAWTDGEPEALDQLMQLVIDDVRTLAQRALSSEAPNHTLQPTELVDEAYLRLIDRKTFWWKDRRQFFKSLADLMKRILVDHARRRKAAKRGGGEPKLPLEEGMLPALEPDTDIEALNEALDELKEIDERRYQIIMLWFFVGLTQKEIARELDMSINTVGRQWKAARLWLKRRIERSDPKDCDQKDADSEDADSED